MEIKHILGRKKTYTALFQFLSAQGASEGKPDYIEELQKDTQGRGGDRRMAEITEQGITDALQSTARGESSALPTPCLPSLFPFGPNTVTKDPNTQGEREGGKSQPIC